MFLNALILVTIAILIQAITSELEELHCLRGRCWDTLKYSQLSILTIILTAFGIQCYQILYRWTRRLSELLMGPNPAKHSHHENEVASCPKASGDTADCVPSPNITSLGTFPECLDLICRAGGILVLFFVCDKTVLIPRAEKQYDRNQFLFLLVFFGLAGLSSTRRCAGAAPQDEVLGREQTEEWKGWMQVQSSSLLHVY